MIVSSPPRVVFAAAVTSAALLLTAAVLEQFAGALPQAAFWPAFWACATVFFAAMAGRLWARVLLAVQAGLTVVLTPTLIVPTPSDVDLALGAVPRPDLAVWFAVAAGTVLVAAAVLAFLPMVPAPVSTHLSQRLRRIVLVVHVTSAVAWLGIITVQGTLGITAVTATDRVLAQGIFTAMLVIDGTFLGPAAFLAFFTGLALAAGTKWGLLRHWWVTTKFATMLVLMVLPVIAWQHVPADGYALAEAGRTLTTIRDTLGVTPHLAMISPALAVFVVVVSIVKPWGRTPIR